MTNSPQNQLTTRKQDGLHVPKGFRFAVTYAGIRKKAANDLALIASTPVANAAALFTTNRVKAAPLLVGMEHLRQSHGKVAGVVINAGNANCATRNGETVARDTCEEAAIALGVPANQVLPSSTGVIGMELDGAKITSQLPRLASMLSPDDLLSVAQAIMTTDTFPKVASRRVKLPGGTVSIAGVTKGAGMIHPNMATTLAFVMTDAALPASALRRLLRAGADVSYHSISVDADTSTNDTLLLMANGASGVKVGKAEEATFAGALNKVLQDLAKGIARDGEGANHLITIKVRGAVTDRAAREIARAIANSPLVKTAIAGNDPNWGRILSAAGSSGVAFEPSAVSIRLQGTTVCRNGLLAPFEEPPLIAKLSEHDVEIDFRIGGKGQGQSTFWTCDLTEDYIRINAEYRT